MNAASSGDTQFKFVISGLSFKNQFRKSMLSAGYGQSGIFRTALNQLTMHRWDLLFAMSPPPLSHAALTIAG
jgi:hypothetical protein